MLTIRQYTEADKITWDAYVHNHPKAVLYHLSGWKNVIEKTYNHKTYYLMATKEELNAQSANLKGIGRGQSNLSSDFTRLSNRTDHGNSKDEERGFWEAERIGSKKQRKTGSQARIQRSTENPQYTYAKPVGILPLVHLNHFLFGNILVSIPFFDMGGILADDEGIEKLLMNEAVRIAEGIKADTIELRHIQPLLLINESSKHQTESYNELTMSYQLTTTSCEFRTHTHKVRMLLYLPDSSEELVKSFKSKLRSQIKKPIKEGLYSKIGWLDLLQDFYKVFSLNMRDLGSPVHSKDLMKNVLEEFPEKAKVVMVYKENKPVAGSIVVGFKDTLENPWASSLRQFSRLSPNMLLYWTMLEMSCDNGFKRFDFGRSSPDEGSYKFKEQWGAVPEQLHWHLIYLNGDPRRTGTPDKTKFDKSIQYWKKLPVAVTKIIGPRIRKYISL